MEILSLQKIIRTFILLSVSLIILVFLAPLVLSFGIRYISYEFQPPLFGSEKLFKEVKLEQEFFPQKDNLTAIGLSVRNFNLQAKGDIILKLFSDGKKIRESVVSGYVIGDGDLVKFKFEAVPDSLGKTFVYRLIAPEVDEEKAFEIYTTNKKSNWSGNLSINNVLMDKSLSSLIYFKPKSRLNLIEDIYHLWIVRFSLDPFFFSFYSLLILGLTSLLLNFVHTDMSRKHRE